MIELQKLKNSLEEGFTNEVKRIRRFYFEILQNKEFKN